MTNDDKPKSNDPLIFPLRGLVGVPVITASFPADHVHDGKGRVGCSFHDGGVILALTSPDGKSLVTAILGNSFDKFCHMIAEVAEQHNRAQKAALDLSTVLRASETMQ